MPNWTGNIFVDSLLLGQKWGDTSLNYFLDDGTRAWTNIEAASMAAALSSWSDVANVTFTRIYTSAGADLIEGLFTGNAGSLGVHDVHIDYSTASVTTSNAQLQGQFNYDGYGWDENLANGGLSIGGLGYTTIVHELGHALGLDHTHADDATDPHSFPGVDSANAQTDTGDNALNQDIYSIMSYVSGVNSKAVNGSAGNDAYGFTGGPGAFDIAAVQYLYGANLATGSGDDRYIIPDTNTGGTYYETIWDSGGTDEIYYAGGLDTTINLNSATIANEEGGGGFLSRADGIYGGFTIAADFTNALADEGAETGVIIENAVTGTGNDDVTGNAVANVIDAGGGSDVARGFAGNDRLIGGTGSDTLHGGDDRDTLFGDNTDGSGALAQPSGISLGSGTVTKAAAMGNDSIATAVDISAAFSFAADAEIENATTVPHVSILGTGDGTVDYYKVTINNAGAIIELDLDHGDDGNSAAQDYDSEISLYKADGTLVANNDDRGALDSGSTSDLDSYLSHAVTDPGIYIIAVGRFSSGSTDPNFVPTDATYELQVSVSGELAVSQDQLFGDSGNDSLFGGDGNDTLDGGTEHDMLYGGLGADAHIGGAGIDYARYNDANYGNITASLGDSAINTGAAAGDTYTGVEGLIMGLGNDSAYGDGGNNYIYGMQGRDALFGGDGADRLIGGSGHDMLYGGLGADRLDGGAGFDYARYNDADYGNIKVSLGSPSVGTGAAAGDTFTGIEGLIMGNGNDWAYGDAGNNYIYGMGGNDMLFGSIGADNLNGGSGFDYARYNDANYAGLTASLLDSSINTGVAAGDKFTAIEGLILTNNNDIGHGDNAGNYLYGMSGNDTLDGHGGRDFLIGGAGNDVFIFDAGSGSDTIRDFAGGAGVGDQVSLSGLGVSTFNEVIAKGAQVGAHSVFTFDTGDVLTLQNTTLTDLTDDDFLV